MWAASLLHSRLEDVFRLAGWIKLRVAYYSPAGDYAVETGSSPHHRLKILYMYFRGFAIPPDDGLQAAAAGGLRAAPPEVLNASNYDKSKNLPSRKRRNTTKNEQNT